MCSAGSCHKRLGEGETKGKYTAAPAFDDWMEEQESLSLLPTTSQESIAEL